MARILVVDDEEMDRVLERSILEEAGHELLFANDGDHALRVYREERVDLVITDLAMPKVNGLRLIKRLLEEDSAAKVIAVSGVSPEQLPRAQDLGAAATLYKPLEREELLETVERVLLGPSRGGWEDVWAP